MDPSQVAVFGIIVMFLLIVLHVPIGISMIVIGVVGFGVLSGFAPAITLLATETANTISNPDLAVIPLFILMGNFATTAGLSEDIYNLAYAFIGHYRGGLALSTIGGCGFFGSVCGSSPATAATFGKVALPEMIKRNYSTAFATGTIAAGGTLGSLVPPSVIMIIYAVIAEEFILKLFIAAVIPAAIEIALYMITIIIYVRLMPNAGPSGPRMGWSDRYRMIVKSWRGILIGITVVGGIYGGVFTVTEAASFGAVLAFIFSIERRKLTKAAFWDALAGTANSTAMIYVVIVGANTIVYFIGLSRFADQVVTGIANLNVPHMVTMGVLLIIYLILGSVFDTVAAMVITLPFVLPLITNMGYSPIWWGVVNVVVIEAGMITPPIGLNVFVLHGVTKVPLGVIYRGTWPFVLADVLRILILLFFPSVVMWLPNLVEF